jgi:hypothetical protein
MKSQAGTDRMPPTRTLKCYAFGRGREWEAICVDLDIAVQGCAFEDVVASLDTAIRVYVESAMAEDEPVRNALLRRRAPLRTRTMYALRFLRGILFRPKTPRETNAEFSVPCPA